MAPKKVANEYNWDPIQFQHEVPSPQCLLRTRRDLKDIYEQPPPGVFVAAEEENLTKIHALVVGPFDTPYEGGFFHFVLKCPPDYPIAPPRVRLLTTGGGRVRFNPNLYACGKVCLSILGTFPGPAWSAAQSIGSVLVSIQSLMNETPLANEPGFEKYAHTQSSQCYNMIIQHETIKVAVCEMVESCLSGTFTLPSSLREVALKLFLVYYDTYENIARSQRHLNGSSFKGGLLTPKVTLNFDALLQKLQTLRQHVMNRGNSTTGGDPMSTCTMPGPSYV